jgi:hypothetical protein
MEPTYLPTRLDLLDLLPKGSTGAELGVFVGDFSQQILDHVKPYSLILIDRWKGIEQSGDKDGKDVVKVDLEGMEQKLATRFQGQPVTIYKGASADTLATFPNRSFDWVYIDACHDYGFVKQDIAVARQKVKLGGVILGHDYHWKKFPGVCRAVNETGLVLKYLTRDIMPSYWLENR